MYTTSNRDDVDDEDSYDEHGDDDDSDDHRLPSVATALASMVFPTA